MAYVIGNRDGAIRRHAERAGAVWTQSAQSIPVLRSKRIRRER